MSHRPAGFFALTSWTACASLQSANLALREQKDRGGRRKAAHENQKLKFERKPKTESELSVCASVL